MNSKDIRLLDASAQQDQDAFRKQLLKTLDDAKDKFDTIEIEHTPIRLLDRVRNRQIAASHNPVTPDITDADQD
jgi:hypothetical protein